VETRMTNRSLEEKRSVEESAAEPEEKKPRRAVGAWRSDFEEELRRYFAGDHAGDAGLRSGIGGGLERMRDGVSGKTGDSSDVRLPRGVDFHTRLEIVQVEFALHSQPERDVVVLRAFYTPRPTGAMAGLLGLEPYAATAILSAAVAKELPAAASHDERAEILRTAWHNSRTLKTPELRAASKLLCKKAVDEAKAEVEAAMRRYSKARQAAKTAMQHHDRNARLEAFRRELGV
jgi:hypothetical protein